MKLYKYLDPARIDNVLPENGPSTLRLSPSSVLNDPFEVMPGLDDFVSESGLAKGERPRWASVDDFEQLENINSNIIKCYTTKSRAWEYEQEWRLILPVPTSPSRVELVKFPRSAVCEIIVSEFTDDNLVSALTARAATYPAATMMRVFPNQRTFECDIEEMSEQTSEPGPL